MFSGPGHTGPRSFPAGPTGGAPRRPPLAQRLRATASARHAAIAAGRTEAAARRYRGETQLAAWTTDLVGLRSRGLENIWIPMLIVALVASGWTGFVVETQEPDGAVCTEVAAVEGAFALLVTALSFLLVFRLNRSATSVSSLPPRRPPRRSRLRASERASERASACVRSWRACMGRPASCCE